MNKNNTEEHMLWQAFKQGDQVALGRLVRQYFTSLLRYGIALGSNKEEVEDAIQELFITLWEKRTTVTSPDNIKAYLFIALRHRLVRDKMRLDRQKTWLERLFSKSDMGNSPEMDWIETERQLRDNHRIQSVLDHLSPRQKEIVQLKFYEGMDNESIAEVMGITKQGAANLLVRTLKDLRSAWQQILSFLIFLQ